MNQEEQTQAQEQTRAQVYCIYQSPYLYNNSKFTRSIARSYQREAFEEAELFYIYEHNRNKIYEYNSDDFIFTLKKHQLASTYEMTKENNSVQYLVQGDAAATQVLEKLNGSSAEPAPELAPAPEPE